MSSTACIPHIATPLAGPGRQDARTHARRARRRRLHANHPRRVSGHLRAGREVHVGGAKVVRASNSDQVTLIGAAVTLHNCLAAADELAGRGISAHVLDLYSVKPIDTECLLAVAAAT